MQITQGFINGLFTTYNTTWAEAYEQTPIWYDKLSTTFPSASRFNVYAWLQRLPALRKWIGPRTTHALATYLQTVENVKYEDTFAIQREDIEDDQYGMFGPALKLLGEQSKKWADQTMAATIEAGTSTVIYDGANFFDANHPVNLYDATILSRTGSAVQSNNFTSMALTPDNFATVRQTMMGWVGEDGKPLGIMPDLLVVPPELEYKARNILNASFIAPATVGGNTQVGANENVLKGAADILVVPEFTSSSAWYLLCTKRAIRPFVWQLRYAPDLVPLISPTDPAVFNQDEYTWGVRARGAAATALWWLAARATA